MTKIKICGIKRLADIEYVNKYMPDYIGFIFVPGKRRFIDPIEAKELINKLNKNIKAVGVFLNADINYLIEAVRTSNVDIIQLHGDEDDDYIKEVKKLNKEIIKVNRISELASYVLYDNIEPGTGIERDYSFNENEKKVFVAGGINIGNIDKALKTKPYCVDVSSGAETDGIKDELKIKLLIERVRNYEG